MAAGGAGRRGLGQKFKLIAMSDAINPMNPNCMMYRSVVALDRGGNLSNQIANELDLCERPRDPLKRRKT
jgi:hypothetical protein